MFEVVLAAMLLAAAPAAIASDVAYVGSATCRSCHETEWTAWQASHHYQAMLPATETSVVGHFDDRTFRYAGLTHRFFERDDRYFVETDDADGQLATFEIAWTFGFQPLQQYLVEFPDGRYQALGIAWDARPAVEGGQRWYHLYAGTGDPVTHEDLLHWTGSFQNWNSRCAACHSTGLEKNHDPGDGGYDTRWSEVNVSCEACHGPGQAHADWAGSDRARRDPGFVNALPAAGSWGPHPERPTFQRLGGHGDESGKNQQAGICAGCHARRAELTPPKPGKPFSDLYQLRLLEDGLYYPDGQIQDEVFVLGSFLQSRMHRAGVSCTDCHDPHSGSLRAEGNALCARCHQPETFDVPAHHRHPAGSAGAACVDCHMPATTYMGVDARRDHSFRVPEPRLTVELGIPNACNRCHADHDAAWAADTLANWFPDARMRATHARVLAAARVNRRDTLPALLEIAADRSRSGILRATALQETGRFPSAEGAAAARAAMSDPDPLVRGAAVRAVAFLPPAQRFAALQSVLSDPARSVRAEVAAQLADVPPAELPEPARSALVDLRNEYLDTLRHNADTPEGLLNLGNFLASSGQPEAAERAYRQALKLAPRFVPVLVNLADLYRASDMDTAAEKLLLDAIRYAPDHAPALHALGLLRVRQGRLDAAVERLARATALDPANPRYAYVYAVALHEQGRREEAVAVLKEALKRHPGDPEIMAALKAYRP